MNEQTKIVDSEHQIHGSVLDYSDDVLGKFSTLQEMLDDSFTKFADYEGLTIRKTFDDEPHTCLYKEIKQNVLNFGAGLNKLLDSPTEAVFIGIYSRNLPEWVYTFLSCVYYNFVAVPMYDTLGEEAIQHISKQTKLSAVICDTVAHAEVVLRQNIPSLSHVIVIQTEHETSNDWKELKNKLFEKVQLEAFENVLKLGTQDPILPKVAEPDDLIQVCYTCGSTGLPKGVIFTQKSFKECIIMVRSALYQIISPLENKVHLSYLPLSHMLEQATSFGSLTYGIKIAYLTTDFKELMSDLKYYRPHIFCTVPRILSRVYTETMSHVNKNRILNWTMQYAIRQKLRQQQDGTYSQTGILDRIFFRAIRNAFGDRIQLVLYGGAPISAEVRRFVKAAFSCTLLEGYGSTETGGIVSIVLPMDPVPNLVGALLPRVEAYLADVTSMGIEVSRDQMGEVCIRSPANVSGYYLDEEKSRELYTDDGFVRTGDIGSWTETGALKIVDRCKSIFKLAQGEYVAPEKIEQIFMCSNLVVNVLVDGSSTFDYAVIIVVPDCDEVRNHFPKQLKDAETDLQNLCQNTNVANLILEELTSLGRAQGLNGFELPKKIYLSSDPFTIENGLLTPTMKVARSRARQHFSQQIKELYSSNNNNHN